MYPNIPVYLYINDSQVELRDASHLWGKDVYETTDQLNAECGDELPGRLYLPRR